MDRHSRTGVCPFGAGTTARQAGVTDFVDPRPYAIGSIAETFAQHPHLDFVLPATGYSEAQLADLAATIRARPCDVVVTGTPIDLAHVAGDLGHPVRHARYELREIGHPDLGDVLAPLSSKWRSGPERQDGPGAPRPEKTSRRACPGGKPPVEYENPSW